MQAQTTPATTRTEIVRATELYERVVLRIAKIRDPESFVSYRENLRRYKRRLGKREEGIREGHFSGVRGSVSQHPTVRGFMTRHLGQEVFVPRPSAPRPPAYGYSPYTGGAYGGHAWEYGLLANPRYNRDIRPQRVEKYGKEMQAGEWRDLLSDPITVTADGQVLNGQHRIAAACDVDWDKAGNDPTFLVIWGADPSEALYADGSRRTHRDGETIAVKVASTV